MTAANTARDYFSSWELDNIRLPDIDELILTLTPEELPFLTGMGGEGGGGLMLPRVPVIDTVHTWQEEEIPLPRTTLAEALDDTETGIDVATGTGINFAVGDSIRIDDEVMLVTAVTTDTLTVTRGSAAGTGTAAAAHSSGAEVVGIGQLLLEGEIADGVYKDRDTYTNYTQIFSRTIEATRTAQQVRSYGVPAELPRQSAHNLHALSLSLEQAIIYGTKFKHASDTLRSMGGIFNQITSHVDSTTDWMTIGGIEDMLAACWDDGDVPDMIVSRPVNFGALTNLEGNERLQTVTIDDARRGRRKAQVVMTEYGDVMLVRHRYMRPSDAIAIKRERCILRPFSPITVEKLAKTKDRDQFMMVGEYSMTIKGESQMAKWSGLDASTALPTDLV